MAALKLNELGRGAGGRQQLNIPGFRHCCLELDLGQIHQESTVDCVGD